MSERDNLAEEAGAEEVQVQEQEQAAQVREQEQKRVQTEQEQIEVANADLAKNSAKPDMPLAKRVFPTLLDMAVMLLIFFATQFAVAWIAIQCGLHLPDMATLAVDDVEAYMRLQVERGEGMAILYPVSMVVSILAIYLYIFLRGGGRRIARFSPAGLNPNIILSGIVWIVVAQIVIEPVMNLLPSVENAGVGRGFWACATAVFFAPVLEETLCRGVILETVRRRWNGGVAILLSALFFGIVHIEPATALAAFVVGSILGVVYLRTKSLFAAIILHSLNNTFAFAAICFGVDKLSLRDMLGEGNLYIVAYGVALSIFLAMSIEAWRKLSSAKA